MFSMGIQGEKLKRVNPLAVSTLYVTLEKKLSKGTPEAWKGIDLILP